jgi:hypothetical protein
MIDNNEKFRVKEDMICPVNKIHCDDECCTVGSICNISGDDFKEFNATETLASSVRNKLGRLSTLIQVIEDIKPVSFNVKHQKIFEKSFDDAKASFEDILAAIEQYENKNVAKEKKICDQKIDGSCPHPNIHCKYPKCEE